MQEVNGKMEKDGHSLWASKMSHFGWPRTGVRGKRGKKLVGARLYKLIIFISQFLQSNCSWNLNLSFLRYSGNVTLGFCLSLVHMPSS